MNPLISICVPIYNVAPYLERCVHSLMQQTYQRLEYIFVDDCSTDNSISLLEEWLERYPERKQHAIIIRNDCNHGLAYTRRISIENAHGEYIVCVDSDDYIEHDMIQCLVTKAIETNADIVAAGYFYESKTTSQIFLPEPCDKETDLFRVTLTGMIHHICSKLFRRSLYTVGRCCYAPEGLDYLEDRMMLVLLGTKLQRVATIDQPLYHYVYRNDSVSQRKSKKHFQCLIRFWEETDKLLDELGLTEKFQHYIGTAKIEDKAGLLMYCDNRTRKQYVNLYAKEEQTYTPKLTRGIALMYWFTKHHLWILTYCYQLYIRWIVQHNS